MRGGFFVTKFYLNPDELKEMLKSLNPVFHNMQGLFVYARTTPEFVREVLPYPLEPVDPPTVLFSMQMGKSYNGLSTYVRCRYDELEGDYSIGFVMDSDLAVIFGRETISEPKKLGKVSFIREGNDMIGSIKRYGVEIVRIEANAVNRAEPGVMEEAENFHFRYNLKPDATGIDNCRLIRVHYKNKVHVVEKCTAKVTLQDTVHDVFGRIPVLGIRTAYYFEFDIVGKGSYLTDELDAERLLPYAFFKHDDYAWLSRNLK
jgi:acetoacetate decarboxylase